MIGEHQRILQAYQKRNAECNETEIFFEYEDLAHLCRIHERHRETLLLLRRCGFNLLNDKKLLDVGCGNGNMLRQFVQWGVKPEMVFGIELRKEPVEKALSQAPNIDVRQCSATDIPWPDKSFDIVCQHTVFTSVIDTAMKIQIAEEMKRVLIPGGAILWYDFSFDNPKNPDVRGVKKAEIKKLFGGYALHFKRVTLAPPIARRIPAPLVAVLYPFLSAVPFLRTHLLGLFVKPKG